MYNYKYNDQVYGQVYMDQVWWPSAITMYNYKYNDQVYGQVYMDQVYG